MEDKQLSEFQEQRAVAAVLRAKGLLFTSTCGGYLRSEGQRYKAFAEGYTKGSPDLLVFEPRGGFHGLFIEMKRGDGNRPAARLDPAQAHFLQRAKDRGYYARVCYGAADALHVLGLYLQGTMEAHSAMIHSDESVEQIARLSAKQACSAAAAAEPAEVLPSAAPLGPASVGE